MTCLGSLLLAILGRSWRSLAKPDTESRHLGRPTCEAGNRRQHLASGRQGLAKGAGALCRDWFVSACLCEWFVIMGLLARFGQIESQCLGFCLPCLEEGRALAGVLGLPCAQGGEFHALRRSVAMRLSSLFNGLPAL